MHSHLALWRIVPLSSAQLHQQAEIKDILMYTLMLDNVVFTDSTDPNLMIEVRPDPSGFMLINDEPIEIGMSAIVQIQVRLAAK